MQSWLVVDGDDTGVELASLDDWLRREDDLRGRVRLVPRSPKPGQLGSVVDVLAVAVGGGGALTALAGSLSVWLRQPRRSTIRVAVAKPDGTKVEITGENLRSADEIEDLLRACLPPEEHQ